MTAIETLERAISKLEQLRDEATPGEWSYRREVLGLRNTTVISGNEQVGYVTVGQFYEGTAEMIVALSRTVEPMLALLREGIREVHRSGAYLTDMAKACIRLAESILGEENDHDR